MCTPRIHNTPLAGLVSLLLCFMLHYDIAAQNAVVPAGGDVSDSRGSVAFTIGQAACTYATRDSATAHQGVQQVTCLPSQELAAIKACDSINWRGHVMHATIDTIFEGFSEGGCDSTVHLVLTVDTSSATHIYAQGAEFYTYNSTTYNISDDYTFVEQNVSGCDSVITLHLTLIYRKPLPVIMLYDDQVLMLDHYPNGTDKERVDYDDYRWLRDGQIIPYANLDNYGVYENGKYQSLSGCYTLEVATDQTLSAYVQSNTICISSVDVEEAMQQALAIKVYPNPVMAGETVNIALSGQEQHNGGMLRLVDAFGREVAAQSLGSALVTMTAPRAAGLYTILITMPGQPSVARKIVVK